MVTSKLDSTFHRHSKLERPSDALNSAQYWQTVFHLTLAKYSCYYLCAFHVTISTLWYVFKRRVTRLMASRDLCNCICSYPYRRCAMPCGYKFGSSLCRKSRRRRRSTSEPRVAHIWLPACSCSRSICRCITHQKITIPEW